jgi:hypothetical protein
MKIGPSFLNFAKRLQLAKLMQKRPFRRLDGNSSSLFISLTSLSLSLTLYVKICGTISAVLGSTSEPLWHAYLSTILTYQFGQLWAVMFRNSSRTLFEQIMSQRFLETLEDALTSPRTEMFVKERHMDVLGAIVYACANGEVSN